MSSFSLVHEPVADRHGPGTAPPVGAVYDAVLVAAQAGAPWAWTLLYRSVAAPLLAVLQAGGDPHPQDTLGEVVVELARGVRTFGGDEKAYRDWVFSIAYRHLEANRHPRLRGLRNFSPADFDAAALWQAPAVPSEVEERHVAGAARAATTGSTAPVPPPPFFRRLRPLGRPSVLFPAVAALFAGAGAKTAVTAAVVLAAVGSTLALDALPQTLPPAQPALEHAADRSGQALPARTAPLLQRAEEPARRSPRAVQAKADAAAAKAAGQATASQARARGAQRRAARPSGPVLQRKSLPPLPRKPATEERAGTALPVEQDARPMQSNRTAARDRITTRVLRDLRADQRR